MRNIKIDLHLHTFNILPRPFEVYKTTGLELEFSDKPIIIYESPYIILFQRLQEYIKWKQ